MTSPPTPEGETPSAASIICAYPGCELPTVLTAADCRAHLADALRAKGEIGAFENDEFAEMQAATVQILSSAFAGVPQELLESGGPSSEIKMYALFDRDADWAPAQMALDFLGTELSDRFGAMRLSAPEQLRPRLRLAMETVIHEFAGLDVAASTAAVLAKERGNVAAVLQAFFPRDLHLARFAEGFNTRDYFRWQIELGEMPGVGDVTSEPSPVLGTKLPDPLTSALPPNLMISFVVPGDLDSTVRSVVADFKSRLGDATQPESIVVDISVTLGNTDADSVRREIAAWNARGYQLFDGDDESRAQPGEKTMLLFEFPLEQDQG